MRPPFVGRKERRGIQSNFMSTPHGDSKKLGPREREEIGGLCAKGKHANCVKHYCSCPCHPIGSTLASKERKA